MKPSDFLEVRDGRKRRTWLRMAAGTQGVSLWIKHSSMDDAVVLCEPEVSVILEELDEWMKSKPVAEKPASPERHEP